MSGLTIEQFKLFDAIQREGKGSSLYLSGVLGHGWNAKRVGRVMRQLKYRSLVKFNGSVWETEK